MLVISVAHPREHPNPYGLAFNSHGDLYVIVNYYNKEDKQGESFTGEYKPEGSVFNPTPIAEIRGEVRLSSVEGSAIAVDQKTNDVFVADTEGTRTVVNEFNESGGRIETIPPVEGLTHHEFLATKGLAFDEAHPALYVTSYHFDKIDVYEPPTYPTGSEPTGIALDQANGVMYVVVNNHTIEKFDEAGRSENFSSLSSSRLSPGGEFAAVAVDNSTEPSDPNKGDLYIANDGNGKIEKFDEAGELKESFTAPPSPGGIAVNSQGNLYVASSNDEGKVFGFSPTGTPLNSGNPVLVISVAHPREHPNPYGLAFNSHGDLYVTVNCHNSNSEASEGFIGEYKPEGSVFNATPIEKELPGGLESSGIVVDQKTNDVFVASYYGSEVPSYTLLKEFNEHGEEIETVRHREFWVSHGIAFNEAHPALYVTSYYYNTVDIYHAYHKGTIDLEVSGFGGVSASPEGDTPPAASAREEATPISYCEESCSEEFEEGSTVTLSAVPVRRDKLVRWEGCTHESGLTCEVTVGSGISPVKAVFELEQYSLTVNETGTGSGTVECGAGACAATYSPKTYLTLNPVPARHAAFAGWSGACTNVSGPCIIEHINEDTQVTATFDQLMPAISFPSASEIGQSTATLSAQVNPEGAATTCKFEYGTTTLYGSQVPCAPGPGSGASPVQVTAALSGLKPTTTYSFRLVATNAGGTTQGEGQTFTTATPETCATNVALCLKPSNKFTIGPAKRQGSAIALRVTLPGPGEVIASGKDLEGANVSSLAPGAVSLTLKLSPAGQKALKKAKRHKLKVNVKVTYTPTAGTANSVATTVTFRGHKG